MVKIVFLYSLLMLSIVFPAFLLVALPLLYLEARRIIRLRRQQQQILEAAAAQHRLDLIHKNFR